MDRLESFTVPEESSDWIVVHPEAPEDDDEDEPEEEEEEEERVGDSTTLSVRRPR